MVNRIFTDYGPFGVLKLCFSWIKTKFFFKKARLIRFPFRVRGKKFIEIQEGFTTGFNCRLDAFDVYKKKEVLIFIGKNVQINDDVHIGAIEKIEIHDNVLIASKVFITDHNHGNYTGINQDTPLSAPKSRPLTSKQVIIEKNVWIGESVSILPGVRIGEGSIIGSSAVVNKDIPPFCIAVGVPAKVVKKFDFKTNEWKPKDEN